MRFTLSALLAVALGVPVLAQSRPVPPAPPAPPAPPSASQDTLRELQALTERLRAIEARLKAQQGTKEGDKKADKKTEEKKVEVVVVGKDGEPKKVTGKEGTHGVIELKLDGDMKGEAGKGVFVIQLDGDKKPEPKKDGDKKPEGPRGSMGAGNFEVFRGQGSPPMGGGFGGGPGSPPAGGMMFMRMGDDFTPPGFDKLSKDEQAEFRKLMSKMRGGDEKKTEVRVREVRRDGGSEGGERRTPPTAERRPDGGDRRPNLEERMDRLERAIEDIRRAMSKK